MNVTVNNTIKQIDVYTEQNVRHYDIHIQGIKWRSSMVGGTLTTRQEMLDASPGFYYILDLTDTHPDFNAKQGVLIVYQNPTGKTYQAIVGDKIWLYKASVGHYYPIEGGGSAYGGVIGTEQEMDTALPGKFYAFSLHESHSEFAASNGALFVMNSDEADGVIQIATVVISGAVKQYARSGEVNAYSPFAEISGGSSSSPTFTSDFVANPAFGKYTAGSTVPANGKTVNEVLLDAFSNYLSPAFTSFSSALATIVEVGTTLTSPQNFTFGVSNSGNIKPNTLKVTDITAGTDLVTGAAISSPVSVPIGAVEQSLNAATNSWRASAQNTQDAWFNSPTFSVTWRLRTFHGAVDAAPANSAEVRALTAAWDTVNSFAITLSKTRYCIALRSGKNLVSVITQNNENLKDNFVKRAEQMLVTLPDGSTTAYDIYDFTSAIVMNVTATVTLS